METIKKEDLELLKFQEWGMFATPESQEALEKYVTSFSKGERGVAVVVMGMTYNWAAALFNKRIDAAINADFIRVRGLIDIKEEN